MTPRWDEKRLKYCVTIVNNKVEGDIPPDKYVGLENIESATGRYVPNGELQVIDGMANRFLKGDVLFSKLRPYLAKVMETDGDGFCTSELLVLRPKLVDRRFLFYCLLDSRFIERVNASAYGSKMPRANWEFIGDQLQVIPTPTVQRAIADYLDLKTAGIDLLIAKKRRIIDLLQQERLAVLDHYLTTGLDEFQPYQETGIGSIRKIPFHWSLSKPKYVCSKIVDGVHAKPEYVDEGIPFITVKNLTSTDAIGFDDLNYIKSEDHKAFIKRANPEKGDVLLTKDGATLGVPRVVETDRPFSIFVSVALLKPIRKLIDSHFLCLALESSVSQDQFKARRAGSAIPHIHLVDLRNIWMALPPLSEQRLLVERIYDKLSKLNKMQIVLQKQIEVLSEYRQALISAAVTGKFNVMTEVAP